MIKTNILITDFIHIIFLETFYILFMLNLANAIDSLISPSVIPNIPANIQDNQNTNSDFSQILNDFFNTKSDTKSQDTKNPLDYISNIFSDILALFQAFNKNNNNQSIDIKLKDATDTIKTDTIKILQDIKSLETSMNPNFDTSVIDNIINDIKNPKPNEDIEISISFEESTSTSFQSMLSSLDKYIFSNKDISSFISQFSFEMFYYDETTSTKQNLLSLKAYNKDIPKDSQNYIFYKNIAYEINVYQNDKTQANNIDTKTPQTQSVNTAQYITNQTEYSTPKNNTKPYQDIKTQNIPSEDITTSQNPKDLKSADTSQSMKNAQTDTNNIKENITPAKPQEVKSNDIKPQISIEDTQLNQKDINPKNQETPMPKNNTKPHQDIKTQSAPSEDITTSQNPKDLKSADTSQSMKNTQTDTNNIKENITPANPQEVKSNDTKPQISIENTQLNQKDINPKNQETPMPKNNTKPHQDIKTQSIPSEDITTSQNPKDLKSADTSQSMKNTQTDTNNIKENITPAKTKENPISPKAIEKTQINQENTKSQNSQIPTTDNIKQSQNTSSQNIKPSNTPSPENIDKPQNPEDLKSTNLPQTELSNQDNQTPSQNINQNQSIEQIQQYINTKVNTADISNIKDIPKTNIKLQDANPIKDIIKDIAKNISSESSAFNQKQDNSSSDNSSQNFNMYNQNQQNIVSSQQTNQTQNTSQTLFESIQKTILKEAYAPPLIKNISITLDDNTQLQLKFNANSLSIAINTNAEIINKEYQTKELIQNLQNLGFAVENLTINGMPVETQTGFSEHKDSKDNESKSDNSEDQDIEFVDAV